MSRRARFPAAGIFFASARRARVGSVATSATAGLGSPRSGEFHSPTEPRCGDAVFDDGLPLRVRASSAGESVATSATAGLGSLKERRHSCRRRSPGPGTRFSMMNFPFASVCRARAKVWPLPLRPDWEVSRSGDLPRPRDRRRSPGPGTWFPTMSFPSASAYRARVGSVATSATGSCRSGRHVAGGSRVESDTLLRSRPAGPIDYVENRERRLLGLCP